MAKQKPRKSVPVRSSLSPKATARLMVRAQMMGISYARLIRKILTDAAKGHHPRRKKSSTTGP